MTLDRRPLPGHSSEGETSGQARAADAYEVPSGRVAHGTAVAPPSKSHTHRALFCAALAAGESRILGPLLSEDTAATRSCLDALGAGVAEAGDDWVIAGRGGQLAEPSAPLDCASSGTTLRLLMALCAAVPGRRVLDGSEQLRRRPLADLAVSLEALGSGLTWGGAAGFPPVAVTGHRWRGGEIAVRSGASSQFLSGLLLAAPLAERPVVLRAPDLVSAPYVALTAAVMGRFGVRVTAEGATWHVALGGYRPACERVEPDASAAAFLFAAAAVTGGEVTVPGLRRDLLQGDAAVLDHLRAFGVRVVEGAGGATASGAPTQGADLDLGACPDLVPPLAAVAFAAPGPSRFRGVGHLRHKESDRLAVLAGLVRALGGSAEAGEGELRIVPPRRPHPADLNPRGDHRMAMAGALMGLRTRGARVLDPACVAKSFPSFWERLDALLG